MDLDVIKLLIGAMWISHNKGFDEAFETIFKQENPYTWGKMQHLSQVTSFEGFCLDMALAIDKEKI